MIDWTKPIESVPDAINPIPVHCEYAGFDGGDHMAFIRGDWYDPCYHENRNDGKDRANPWYYGEDGDSNCRFLPIIRNVGEAE